MNVACKTLLIAVYMFRKFKLLYSLLLLRNIVFHIHVDSSHHIHRPLCEQTVKFEDLVVTFILTLQFYVSLYFTSLVITIAVFTLQLIGTKQV